MKKFILIALILLSTTNCGISKQSMGIGRSSPDEFMVIKRQPLTLPPEYNLIPPGTEVPTSKSINPQEEAKKILLGENTSNSSTNLSSTDKSFLQSIDATSSDANIRETLQEEIQNDPANNKYLVNNLMFWKEKDNSVIVDNIEEAKRIKKNKENNLNINEGEVIVIDPIQ